MRKEGGAAQRLSVGSVAPWPAQARLGPLTTRCVSRALDPRLLFQGLSGKDVAEP